MGGDSTNRKAPTCNCAGRLLGTSALVRRFASKIADFAGDRPILDVACGSGRNAMFLAHLGCTVICLDKDLTALQAQQLRLKRTLLRDVSARLILHQLDLVKDTWPFSPCTMGGILNIHFLLPALFPRFRNALVPGGYLLLETIPAYGGNYVDLPKTGTLRSALQPEFDVESYHERNAGPPSCDAVTVRLLAKRRSISW
jgi:SAM-dependent methyltransferase